MLLLEIEVKQLEWGCLAHSKYPWTSVTLLGPAQVIVQRLPPLARANQREARHCPLGGWISGEE